jgi:hypothetical protein
MRTLIITLALLTLTGCATVGGIKTDAAAVTATVKADVGIPTASPLQTLADGIGQLADHPLFKAVIQDATDTQVWVNNAGLDPLNTFRASQCPTAILLATQDFQAKAKGFQAMLTGLDAKIGGLSASGGPEIILFLTKLRYGQGPAVDPKAQVQQIKTDVTNRVTAVVDSCRAIVPLKQINEVLKIAGKAGLTIGSGGAAAPFLGLIP